jgi:hypothetical protein
MGGDADRHLRLREVNFIIICFIYFNSNSGKFNDAPAFFLPKKYSTILSFTSENTGRKHSSTAFFDSTSRGEGVLPGLIETACRSKTTRRCRYLQHGLQRFFDQPLYDGDKMG